MNTVWVLSDQLSPEHGALARTNPRESRVLMVESRARGSTLRYHKLKLVLVYSAMRHFAQDLRRQGEPHLFHSVLSPLLNLGLLTPGECVEAAIGAYKRGAAPLNSGKGYVRQVVGWREFINGVYWFRGPDDKTLNSLGAIRALPKRRTRLSQQSCSKLADSVH